MSTRHLNRIIIAFKKLKERFASQSVPSSYICKDVPYFSQFESRELVQDFLSGKLEAKGDPNWKNSGAASRAEYADWAWSGCGMACLKMILAQTKQQTVPLVTLGKQCLSYGGYKLPLKDHPGLYYQPFTEFVRKEYNLKARACKTLTIGEIVSTLSQHSFIIASVNPAIRDQGSKPESKSGHLILIIGYTKKVLYFHNPSGTTKNNQEYVAISFEDFGKFFSHRGIIIHS